MTKRSMLDEISKISFVIDELRLFLDTHPDCTEAIQMIKNHMTHRASLVANYTANYGPIEAYAPFEGCAWLWNEGPMPWEGDC